MREEEIYFISIGCICAVLIGFLVGRNSKSQGYSFGKSFFFSCIGLIGLVFVLWEWYWT